MQLGLKTTSGSSSEPDIGHPSKRYGTLSNIAIDERR